MRGAWWGNVLARRVTHLRPGEEHAVRRFLTEMDRALADHAIRQRIEDLTAGSGLIMDFSALLGPDADVPGSKTQVVLLREQLLKAFKVEGEC